MRGRHTLHHLRLRSQRHEQRRVGAIGARDAVCRVAVRHRVDAAVLPHLPDHDAAEPVRAECPLGATCKLLSVDKDPCDNGQQWPKGAHPCQATNNCGLCTFP